MKYKIDYAENCFHARHITLFYKISCSCKGWNCPWFKSRLGFMKRFWVSVGSGPCPYCAVTNPGKYKICSPTNLIWYPTKEHGMSVVCTVHILAQRYSQYISNLHIFFAAARKIINHKSPSIIQIFKKKQDILLIQLGIVPYWRMFCF